MAKSSFKPLARLMEQLGEQLIKNESIAILELVKNSYDAFSTKVEINMKNIDSKENGVIIIKDNGEGMTVDRVLNTWMVPGTNSKVGKKDAFIEKEIEGKKVKRRPLGEKGIGRFGVHKLGAELELITKSKDKKEVRLYVNWDDFSNTSKYLNDIEVDIEEREPEVFLNSTGTMIIINKIKKEWSRGMLRNVYRGIKSLDSPFKSLDSFETFFKTNRNDWLKDILSYNDIKEYSMFTLSARIEANSITKFEYNFIPRMDINGIATREPLKSVPILMRTQKSVDKNNTNDKRSKEFIEYDLSKYQIGSVEVELKVFDLDHKILDGLGIKDKDAYKNYLKKHGGISIYRDNIKIHGYDENEGDWLGLDIRRINQPSKRISRNIIIGAVYLDQSESKDLIEKTNREGFLDNLAYQELVNSMLFLIGKFEDQRFLDKPNLRALEPDITKATKKTTSENLANLEILVDEKIKDIPIKKELLEKINEIKLDYKEISDIYLKAATSGMSLSIVIHEVEKIISELSKIVSNNGDSKRVKLLVRDLQNVVGGYSKILRNKRKQYIAAKDLFIQAEANVQYRLRAHGIEIVRQYEKSQYDLNIKCSENLILGILMNIIDNSIYWTEYYKIENKKILFDVVFDDITQKIGVIIVDNGNGFNINTNDIIKPFVSGKDAGIGLGLYLANEVMQAHNGQILFPNNIEYDIPEEFINGALIVLTFEEAKR